MKSPCSKCVVYAMCEQICDEAQDDLANVDEYSIEIYNRQVAKSDRITKAFFDSIDKIADSILTGKKL